MNLRRRRGAGGRRSATSDLPAASRRARVSVAAGVLASARARGDGARGAALPGRAAQAARHRRGHDRRARARPRRADRRRVRRARDSPGPDARRARRARDLEAGAGSDRDVRDHPWRTGLAGRRRSRRSGCAIGSRASPSSRTSASTARRASRSAAPSCWRSQAVELLKASLAQYWMAPARAAAPRRAEHDHAVAARAPSATASADRRGRRRRRPAWAGWTASAPWAPSGSRSSARPTGARRGWAGRITRRWPGIGRRAPGGPRGARRSSRSSRPLEIVRIFRPGRRVQLFASAGAGVYRLRVTAAPASPPAHTGTDQRDWSALGVAGGGVAVAIVAARGAAARGAGSRHLARTRWCASTAPMRVGRAGRRSLVSGGRARDVLRRAAGQGAVSLADLERVDQERLSGPLCQSHGPTGNRTAKRGLELGSRRISADSRARVRGVDDVARRDELAHQRAEVGVGRELVERIGVAAGQVGDQQRHAARAPAARRACGRECG